MVASPSILPPAASASPSSASAAGGVRSGRGVETGGGNAFARLLNSSAGRAPEGGTQRGASDHHADAADVAEQRRAERPSDDTGTAADTSSTADAAAAGATPAPAAEETAAGGDLAQWLQQMGLWTPASVPANPAAAAGARGGAPGLDVDAAVSDGQPAAGAGARTGRANWAVVGEAGEGATGTSALAAGAAAATRPGAGADATAAAAALPEAGGASSRVSRAQHDLPADGQGGAAAPGAWAAALSAAMPGAAAPTTAATSPVVQVPVAVPVHDPEFGGAVMGQVVQLVPSAQGGVQQAELHLNPAGMGPIMVQIELNPHQTQGLVQVQFEASHAHTRALLEQSLPALAEALRQDGLQLGSGSVVAPTTAAAELGGSSSQTSDASAQSWGGAGQMAQGGRGGQGDGGGRSDPSDRAGRIGAGGRVGAGLPGLDGLEQAGALARRAGALARSGGLDLYA